MSGRKVNNTRADRGTQCRVLWHTWRRTQGCAGKGNLSGDPKRCLWRTLCLAKHCFLAKPSTVSWGQTPDQADAYRTSRQAYRTEISWSEKKQASFLLTIKPDRAVGQQPSPSSSQRGGSIPRAVIKTFWTVLDLRCLFMLKSEIKDCSKIHKNIKLL